MSVTREQQHVYYQNIKNHLAKIGQIVGFEVGLFLADSPSYSPIRELITDATYQIVLDVFNHSIQSKDKYYEIRGLHNSTSVTHFKVVYFPGCCALAISTGAVVTGGFRNRGINKIGIKIRQEIAKISGFTSLLCTDVEQNKPERKTLAGDGWKDIYAVKNRRTANTVIVSVKQLEHS